MSAKYQIENIYALPYIGVHAITLYAGLGMFAAASWPVYLLFYRVKPNYQFAKVTASVMAVVGSIVKLGSYIDYEKQGTVAYYVVGHCLI